MGMQPGNAATAKAAEAAGCTATSGSPAAATSSEPLRFALNLSASSPILDLQLGVRDNNTVLDPLQSFAKGKLLIDYASLVIAPFGGQLGERTYTPGISIGFAATIAGVPVDAAFAVDFTKPRIEGNFTIGQFSVGGLTVKKTSGEFLVDPTSSGDKFALDLSGGVDLPSLEAGQPGGTASGALRVRVGANGLTAGLEVHASNIGLAGVARLDRFDLQGSLNVGSSASPAVALNLDAKGTLFGAAITAGGSLDFSDGRLTSLAVRASVDAKFGPAELTGPGCTASGTTTGPGACVNFSYANGDFSAALAATLKVSGFEIALSGSVSRQKIAAAGMLNISGVGSFAMGGALYLADGTDLAGNSVTKGDFDFAAAISTASFAGFEASVSASVVRRSANVKVAASGSVTTPAGSVRGAGTFVYDSGQLTYDFAAAADITIAGINLAAASVRLVQTTRSFSATVNASVAFTVGKYGLSGKVNGTFNAEADTGRVRYNYNFAGNLTLALPAITANASFTFHDGDFAFSVSLGSQTIFNVTIAGSISRSGTVTASASLSILAATAMVTVDNVRTATNPTGGWRVGATLSYLDHTFAYATIQPGQFTAGVNFAFDKYGEIDLWAIGAGVSLKGYLDLSATITKDSSWHISGSFAGKVNVRAWYRLGFGDRHTLADFGGEIKKDGTVCGTVKGHEICRS